ncbi:MAG TPA: hypothetical protein VKJ07_02735 [Mycobacteriales bacterium]|nr:hypothetical protein [Mycobacteriales bacterium]
MDTRYCPGCRAERAVEQPTCIDGHLDCPEWACIDCGTAIVIGWLAADAPAPAARRRSHAA